MTFEEQGIKTKHNAGARYATLCPQCSHLRKDTNKKKECLTVNNESGNRWWKCFAGDTKIVTINGLVAIETIVGTIQKLLTLEGWVEAPIIDFGKQGIWELELAKDRRTKTIRTTIDHEWILKNKADKVKTTELNVGDILQSSFIPNHDYSMDITGIRHGFVFGDGYRRGGKGRRKKKESIAVFVGEKIDMMPFYQDYDKRWAGNRIPDLPFEWKDLPDIESSSPAYLRGFISGYFAADGTIIGKPTIASSVEKNLIWIKNACYKAGYNTGEIFKANRLGINNIYSDMFYLGFKNIDERFLLRTKHRLNFTKPKFSRSAWRVVSVKKTESVENVYCAFVDGINNFTIDGDILTGNCNHCFWSGNLDLIERFDKVYQASYKPKGELPKFYSAKVNEFIQNKGLKAETFQQLGIYEPIGEGNSKQRLIAYPYYFKHSMRNVMFRIVDYNSERDKQREWQISKDHGTESIFWGLDDLDFEHKEIIIVEGQTDRITWVECGYKNVLSIPMGGIDPKVKNLENKLAFLNQEFFDFIKPMFNNLALDQNFRFVIVMDNDEVGINTTEILAARLGKQHCYKPFYPKDYKDSNEIYGGNLSKDLAKLGKKGIDTLYTNCKPFQMSGVIKLHQIRESVDRFAKNGMSKGLITGVDHYDKLLSIKPKMLMGVTGIPKMGKTVFVRDYLVNLTRNNPGMKWGMFSPEQRGGENDVEREYLALCENYAGGKFYEGKAPLTSTQREKAMDWVGDNFFIANPTRQNFNNFGKDDANPATLQNLFDYFLYLKKTEGIFGFVLDAWNRVEHVKNKGENDEGFVGRELNRILDFLRAYDLACIIVAHPTKMERLDGKNYDMPQMYNIKGSSAWMERLDIGVSVHRPKLYVNRNADQRGAAAFWERDNQAHTEIELQILKFQELGSPGKSVVSLDWHRGERFIPYKEPKPENNEPKETKPKSDAPKTVKIAASVGEPIQFEEFDEDFEYDGSLPF